MALRCNDCGYDNDPTRVYCHNCGVRLDRGAAPAPPPTGFTPAAELAKLRKPRAPVPWGRYFRALGRLAVLAALVAGVVLALLPPRDVPPPVAPDEGLASRLSGLLGDASSADEARAFGLRAAEVNRWLVSTVQLEESSGVVKLNPRRLYAVPGEGRLRVGLEAGLPWQAPVFFEGDYVPVRDGAGYVLEPRGYSIGRLRLPVLLGWPVKKQFDALAEALAGPLGQLARASHIGITPENVTLRWSGSSR